MINSMLSTSCGRILYKTMSELIDHLNKCWDTQLSVQHLTSEQVRLTLERAQLSRWLPGSDPDINRWKLIQVQNLGYKINLVLD